MKSLITAPLLLIFSAVFLNAQPEFDWTATWKLKNKYLSALEKGEESQDIIVASFKNPVTISSVTLMSTE